MSQYFPAPVGERIKLIICHIGHDPSVTIDEITITIEKKNVRWRSQYLDIIKVQNTMRPSISNQFVRILPLPIII